MNNSKKADLETVSTNNNNNNGEKIISNNFILLSKNLLMITNKHMTACTPKIFELIIKTDNRPSR